MNICFFLELSMHFYFYGLIHGYYSTWAIDPFFFLPSIILDVVSVVTWYCHQEVLRMLGLILLWYLSLIATMILKVSRKVKWHQCTNTFETCEANNVKQIYDLWSGVTHSMIALIICIWSLWSGDPDSGDPNHCNHLIDSYNGYLRKTLSSA